jgi:hypothetical protein
MIGSHQRLTQHSLCLERVKGRCAQTLDPLGDRGWKTDDADWIEVVIGMR